MNIPNTLKDYLKKLESDYLRNKNKAIGYLRVEPEALFGLLNKGVQKDETHEVTENPLPDDAEIVFTFWDDSFGQNSAKVVLVIASEQYLENRVGEELKSPTYEYKEYV